MNRTMHFELKKPEGDDFYNIEDHNDNMDVIDAALYQLQSESSDHYKRQLNSPVPRTAWKASGNTYYPYKADVAFQGCTADYSVDVIFNLEQIALSIFAQTAETAAGKVTIYAASVPEGAITIPVIELRKPREE